MRHFEPWVGANYWTTGFKGVRLLILGESHYDPVGGTQPNYTREVVLELGLQNRSAFFTKIAKLAGGIGTSWISDQARSDFWDRVAFYNFVQSFLPKPRARPKESMWHDAVAAFQQTMLELRPHMMLVLGRELKNHLPQVPDGTVVCGIVHPSARFEYNLHLSDFARCLHEAQGLAAASAS